MCRVSRLFDGAADGDLLRSGLAESVDKSDGLSLGGRDLYQNTAGAGDDRIITVALLLAGRSEEIRLTRGQGKCGQIDRDLAVCIRCAAARPIARADCADLEAVRERIIDRRIRDRSMLRIVLVLIVAVGAVERQVERFGDTGLNTDGALVLIGAKMLEASAGFGIEAPVGEHGQREDLAVAQDDLIRRCAALASG